MDRLSPEERAMFVRAASAALATKERMELIREQAAEATGGAGTVPLDPGRSRSVAAPGEDLMAALDGIMRAHPDVAALRFRGHVFLLLTFQGARVVSVLPENAVLDIEG
ncbi:MAG TPA: hypothetical protein VGH33_20525 [Isosphaeraceae bacterium]|jgi:hypothetical protein